MSNPIYYIKGGCLSFADKEVFSDIELYLYQGEKICLVGRNGSGKSSLMKVISQDYEMEAGEVYQHPAANVGYLRQDNIIGQNFATVYDFVADALKDDSEKYKAEMIFDKLSIDGSAIISSLSGGQIRRVSLAKVLINQPEILLLDEPTNHLDIAAIEWLEDYLKTYPGAVVCISHDRAFLSNVTNRLWWLDRAILRKSDEGFGNFESWREQVLEYEEAVLRKLGKKLDEENLWLSQGVTARRKRNQKRLADLMVLRKTMAVQNAHVKSAKQKINIVEEGDVRKSKFIIEATNLNFSYEGKKLISDFSFRCKKGEVIGLVGPNGSGKTTLIKLLLKELVPDSGKVSHGTGLEVSYFDQHRSSLNPSHSLKQILCPGGGDQVFLANGKTMHVAGYIKNFMFNPKLLDAKLSTLSGGEANRLLLAKTLINPGNFLVLDEPTNDLDMDSLDVLIEVLSEYKGTVLIVSHDRDFLNRLVTRSLVFSEGSIVDMFGSYEDYTNLYGRAKNIVVEKSASRRTKSPKPVEEKPKSDGKLSYKEKRLLEVIPGQIEELEVEVKAIEEKLSNADFYSKDPASFNDLSQKLVGMKEKIELLTDQWLKISHIL
ncbi:MAG: ATP-binding cassette domain-containing protein [Rickettsiaceae bacterium]|nr:ATP-binding cassette domain-containing protein [Rickettsiaceae bacterium]